MAFSTLPFAAISYESFQPDGAEIARKLNGKFRIGASASQVRAAGEFVSKRRYRALSPSNHSGDFSNEELATDRAKAQLNLIAKREAYFRKASNLLNRDTDLALEIVANLQARKHALGEERSALADRLSLPELIENARCPDLPYEVDSMELQGQLASLRARLPEAEAGYVRAHRERMNLQVEMDTLALQIDWATRQGWSPHEAPI